MSYTIEQRLKEYCDIEEQADLKKHTTFRVGGIARGVLYPKNIVALSVALMMLEEEEIAYRFFGKGSNILCSDEYYDGFIFCLDRYFNNFFFEEDGHCVVEAGTSIIMLSHEAMKRELSGLEFASGIPGTVGGAIFMNAGAYKSSMKDIVEEVLVYKDHNISWMPAEDIGFAYRTTIFQKNRDWIVLGAKLKLDKGDQLEIKQLIDSRRKRRMESQPLNFPSAGSMFRNPENEQAWELIERVNLRGHKIGNAQVSEKHANFIVNAGGASANDVLSLVTFIQQKVKDESGIELKMEVEKFNWIK